MHILILFHTITCPNTTAMTVSEMVEVQIGNNQLTIQKFYSRTMLYLNCEIAHFMNWTKTCLVCELGSSVLQFGINNIIQTSTTSWPVFQ